MAFHVAVKARPTTADPEASAASERPATAGSDGGSGGGGGAAGGGSGSYLLMMLHDVDFLPAPVEHDPLMLDWFDAVLPWLLVQPGAPPAAGHEAFALPPSLDLVRASPAEPPLDTWSVHARHLAPSDASAAAAAALLDARREQQSTLVPYGYAEEMKRARTAQAAILAEASRAHALTNPSELPAAAAKRARDGGTSAAGWRWEAFQVLMYGSACYSRLLARLPLWIDHQEISAAARVVQTAYRERLKRKFRGVGRQAVAQHKEQQARAITQAEVDAACRLQARWRGTQVRRALADAEAEGAAAAADPTPARLRRSSFFDEDDDDDGEGGSSRYTSFNNGRARSSTSTSAKGAELRKRKSEYERMKLRSGAAKNLQRGARMMLARRAVDRMKMERHYGRTAAAQVLEQEAYVAALEKLARRRAVPAQFGAIRRNSLTSPPSLVQVHRHRQSHAVMWGVYEQVCLAYDLPRLEEAAGMPGGRTVRRIAGGKGGTMKNLLAAGNRPLSGGVPGLERTSSGYSMAAAETEERLASELRDAAAALLAAAGDAAVAEALAEPSGAAAAGAPAPAEEQAASARMSIAAAKFAASTGGGGGDGDGVAPAVDVMKVVAAAAVQNAAAERLKCRLEAEAEGWAWLATSGRQLKQARTELQETRIEEIKRRKTVRAIRAQFRRNSAQFSDGASPSPLRCERRAASLLRNKRR